MLHYDHDLHGRFEKNLQLLPMRLQDRIRKVPLEEVWKKVEVRISDEGYPVCSYQKDGQVFQITSQRPVYEAEYWCKHIHLLDACALFVYGCGFGYPLLELFKQKQPNTLVMVFEQSVELFVAMLHYFDLEPMIRSLKFSFFVGNFDDFAQEFHQVFFSEVFLYATAPLAVFSPTSQRNFKKEYLKIHLAIFKELSLNVFYMGNDHNDTLLGFHNLISNVREVIENPYLDLLKDRYRNVPAFIIANGPSLDKNMHELKNIGRKGLIISTESAIVPLMKNGITPDILTIVERTKYTYSYHIKDRNYPDSITLLALALIHRRVYPHFPGPRIPIFRSTESMNQWMNRVLADGRSGMDTGANVSHLAFELAIYMGANPIILVGQDFAFGPDGTTHSKDAAYLEEKDNEIVSKLKAKPVVYVESNDGKWIPSTQLWLDFKQGLERKIAQYPQVRVLNATEGGAKIEGTTCIPLREAVEKHCTTPLPARANELVLEAKKQINMKQRKEKMRRLIREVEEYAHRFRRLSQLAIKRRFQCRQMLDLLEQENAAEKVEQFEKAYEENLSDLRKFMEDNLYFVFLQQVLLGAFHKMNRLGVIHSLPRIRQVFQILDEMFHHFNLICQSVSVHFEMAMEKLEQIYEEI